MKAVRRPGFWIQGMAVVLALLLGGVLAWEWEQGLQLERKLEKMHKLPTTAVPPLKIQPEFRLPDAASGFPELLARPIFSISRRPMASASQGAPGALKRGQFVLVGVVIAPGQQSALLREVESGKTQTVAMGARIGGMTLGEVEANRVVLRMGAESEELPLKVMVGVKPPSPPLPQAAPAPAPAPANPKELTTEERVAARKQNKMSIEERARTGLPPPTVPLAGVTPTK